jgi:hypothetical protein
VLLSFAEFVGVLVDVLGVDAKQRLLSRKGVGPEAAARFETGRRLGQATGVGGNRAFLVAGLDGAKFGERGAQGLGFLGCDGRLR